MLIKYCVQSFIIIIYYYTVTQQQRISTNICQIMTTKVVQETRTCVLVYLVFYV